MSQRFVCPDDDCDNAVVLVESGGVARQLICTLHNKQMKFDEHVETVYTGHHDPENDYQIRGFE